jgi:hypothetical protein
LLHFSLKTNFPQAKLLIFKSGKRGVNLRPTTLLMNLIRLSRFFVVTVLLSTVPFAAAALETNSSPAARVEKARAEKKIDDRLHALAGVGQSLALQQVSAALEVAEGLEQLRERIALTESALKRWGELAPAEAFEHVGAMPEGYSKVAVIRSVAASYAGTNSPASAAALTKMKPGRGRNEAGAIIAEIWARNDVNAALKWANDLPEGILKETALRNIYFVWVHSDPVAASAIVQKLPADEIKNALIINVAGDWARINPAAAIKWAEELPLQADKDLAVAIAIESWADSEPLAAAQFALTLSETPQQQQAVLSALARWATQDPEAAFAWAAKSSDRSLQERGIAQVLNLFAPVSPETASRCVENLPAGPIRDNAIGAYVEAVEAWNPEAASRLAFKTQEPSSRQQRVEQTFRLWLSWDPNSARAWLAITDFAEEVKRNWLADVPNRNAE